MNAPANEADVRLGVPLNPTLDAEEKSAVCPDRFSPTIRSTRTVYFRPDGPKGRCERVGYKETVCTCLQYDSGEPVFRQSGSKIKINRSKYVGLQVVRYPNFFLGNGSR